MADTVTVRVPATSANLGPGFDCLGLALALTVDVTVSFGSARPDLPRPPRSVIAMASAGVRVAYGAAPTRRKVPDFQIAWEGDLPLARGLGASAAARAAGLVAANAVLGDPLQDDRLLSLGAKLEGHADNIAPALFGSMQVTAKDGNVWRRIAVAVPAGLKVVLLVPDFEMPTRESRKRLPKQLARNDAVFNVGRAALLVAALSQGRWELLDTATQDRLHQPARAQIFTALDDIITAAKDGGAHAAYLSGGGSTIAALTTAHDSRVARLMQQAAIARGYSARTMITEVSERGATVVQR